MPKNLLNNFIFKNYFFGATDIVKNSDKNKYGYSGFGIAFVGAVHGVLVMNLMGIS